MKQISQRLGVYRLTGEVLWYHRIQSGKAKVGSYYIKLAEEGTPDWIALIRGREEQIVCLFLEAKSDNGIVRDTQKTFMSKYGIKKDIHIMVIRDIKQLDTWVDTYAKDFVSSIGTI